MFLLSGDLKREVKDLSQQLEILREISRKLDQLIILTKLSNLDIIEKYKIKIRGDQVSARILDYSDGSMSYSNLSRRISEELGVAEITVKRKISDLREMGFLVGKRRGRQVYYVNSELFE